LFRVYSEVIDITMDIMNISSDNNASVSLSHESLLNLALSRSRSLLYMWSPSETSFAKVEDVPNYIDMVSL